MFLTLVSAAALATCRVDHARYVLRTAPGVTADFRPINSGADWPSGLVLTIQFSKSRRAYWFLPWDGGTNDVQYLASTTDVDQPGWRPPSPDGGPRPLGDLEYLATGADYRLTDHVPKVGDQAPAHFLLPNLGDRTWHSNHDDAPKQFFDLVSCSVGR
jgi:hypothetical protein